MKRLLMIAYHFPPFAGSSGIQRTLRFAQHLPALGWEPLVLSAHPRAYERTSDDQLCDVDPATVVERAFALDSARHLSLRGRYAAFTARPDRWVSWWLGAVPKGLKMIRQYRPQLIWSTYPIATAHKIAHTLHRLSGLPWIADFRDPMAQDGYPADPKVWAAFQRMEDRALHRAVCSVFVTNGAARMYRERYPDLPPGRIAVIENGYDEESFAALEQSASAAGPLLPGTITLLHSGVVYPSERDPTHLFRALRGLLECGALPPGSLRVRLRGAGHESTLARLVESHGVGQVVELAPPIPYRDALREMMRAEGLLVLQAANCNDQVPAKVYEYLRCGRPIVALADPVGETAALLRRAGVDRITPLDSADEIARALRRFIDQASSGEARLPDTEFARSASRLGRTRELVGLLEHSLN